VILGEQTSTLQSQLSGRFQQRPELFLSGSDKQLRESEESVDSDKTKDAPAKKATCRHPNMSRAGRVAPFIIVYECPDCGHEEERDVG